MKRMPLVVLTFVLGLFCGRPAPAEGLRALIFTGQNNHNWRETTPKLKAILESDGRFAVDVTEHPEQYAAASLAPYDVIVSDWNTWGKPRVAVWPDAMRAAFLDFVRGGKGFVVVHAGGSSFGDWPEYQQIAGAWWELSQTSHGAPHRFTVKPIADHPIMRGVAPFTTTDELWQKPGIHPAAEVLATGDDQPIAAVTRFGQGRGFALLLGHSAAFMDTPGFRTLLCRGTQWAATGDVAPHDVLEPLSRYEYGQSRAILQDVASLAQAAPREVAPQLAALLESDATLDAKKFACEQLGLIGTAAEVPALARQLSDLELAFAARAALERIPGDEPLAALRAALPAVSRASRQGIVNSLAARRDAQAVPLLAGLLPDSADALAGIATPQALEVLLAARPQPTAACSDFREVLADTDIEAVVIATPDHWHVPMSLAAVRAGKDVYCEKPLGISIEQNKILRKAVHQHGAVFQYGTQQRSFSAHCGFACELVRNGYIGEIRAVHVIAPNGARGGDPTPQPVPDQAGRSPSRAGQSPLCQLHPRLSGAQHAGQRHRLGGPVRHHQSLGRYRHPHRPRNPVGSGSRDDHRR